MKHAKSSIGRAALFVIVALSLAVCTPGFGADKVKVGPRKSSTETSGSSTEVNLVYENSKLNTVDSSGTVTPVVTPTVEVVTATNAIAATETGSVFYLAAAGGFVSTLPAPAAGLKFTFTVSTAPTTSYTIVTTSSANIIHGQIATAEDAGGTVSCTASSDTITFVANKAIKGDTVTVQSDGTSWYVSGLVKLHDAATTTQAN